MKQLTEKQAIELIKNNVLANHSPKEQAILQLFQDHLFINVDIFATGLSDVFGRRVHSFDLSGDLRGEFLRKHPEFNFNKVETDIFGLLNHESNKVNSVKLKESIFANMVDIAPINTETMNALKPYIFEAMDVYVNEIKQLTR